MPGLGRRRWCDAICDGICNITCESCPSPNSSKQIWCDRTCRLLQKVNAVRKAHGQKPSKTIAKVILDFNRHVHRGPLELGSMTMSFIFGQKWVLLWEGMCASWLTIEHDKESGWCSEQAGSEQSQHAGDSLEFLQTTSNAHGLKGYFGFRYSSSRPVAYGKSRGQEIKVELILYSGSLRHFC